ncbi:MAG: ribonuclease III [Acidobacteriota bacterium]
MISVEREKLLSELEQIIGYSFRSRALLDRALTHRSFANEQVNQNCQHNESLEFLGDSVLGLVVSAWLLHRNPTLAEGKLSKMKAYLVSEPSLVELADNIELGKYILLNRGEEKTGGRRKSTLLADAYEALIGAVYLDGGLIAAEKFLFREMRDKVAAIDPHSMIGSDYKSALQEQLQAMGAPAPKYVVVETIGPDHRRTFRIELRVSGYALASGEGRSIKIAQQEAAQTALTSPDTVPKVRAILAGKFEAYISINGKNQPVEEESVWAFVALVDELANTPAENNGNAATFRYFNYDESIFVSDGESSAKNVIVDDELKSYKN